MSNEVPFDDDLLVKAYDVGQQGVPLAEHIDAVINGSDKIEDNESCMKSETDEPNSANDATFVVGDFVRCTYDDGIDYEAKILSINSNKNACRIRYAGYGNEQTVSMDALIASWGEEARQAQCTTAAAEKTAAAGVSKKSKTTSKSFNPPPVPPIPPMLFDSDDEEKNQQFAQLLISWFMTGYYTGLHQRTMQESKKLKK